MYTISDQKTQWFSLCEWKKLKPTFRTRQNVMEVNKTLPVAKFKFEKEKKNNVITLIINILPPCFLALLQVLIFSPFTSLLYWHRAVCRPIRLEFLSTDCTKKEILDKEYMNYFIWNYLESIRSCICVFVTFLSVPTQASHPWNCSSPLSRQSF